jgi:hypothetical protein
VSGLEPGEQPSGRRWMPRTTTGREDAALVQLSGDWALDTTRLAVLISRLQQHHPEEIVQLAIPVEKHAYLQRGEAPQSRILGP